jgi:hypothetical protein
VRSRAKRGENAYKGSRPNVSKILAHVRLLPSLVAHVLAREVDRLIANQSKRLNFGSLIRGTVERFETAETLFVSTAFHRAH